MADDANRVVVSIEAQTQQLEQGARRADQVFDKAMTDIERSASNAERQIVSSSENSARSLERIRASSGATRAGMQQLSFQLSDVAQGFALGVSPMTIFAQQSGQVIQALQIMGTESKGLIGFLGGPWGIAFSAAISIAGALASALFSGADAAKTDAEAHDELTEAVDRLNNASAAEQHTTRQGIIDDINRANSLRVREIQTRKTLQAELELARGELERSRKQTGVAIVGSAGAFQQGDSITAAVTSQKIADLNSKLAQNARDIVKATVAIATGNTKIVMRDVAAATDKVTAATQHYDDELDLLTRRYQAAGSKISKTEFESQALALARAKDAAIDAARAEDRATHNTRAHGSASRSAADSVRALAAAESALKRTLDGLEDKYDPVTAAVRKYHEALVQIASLNLDPATAAKYAEGARKEFEKARADLFNLPVVEEYRADEAEKRKRAKADADIQAKAAADAERQAQRIREENVRTTANLYYDLFSGGTHRLWQDFERIGLQIISKLLAEWTINSFAPKSQGGAGGGLGGLIGSIGRALGIGGSSVAPVGTFSIPGIGDAIPFIAGARAGGGPVEAGRLYKINEQGTEGFRPQGSGTIIPLGGMKAAMAPRGGTVVHQYFTLDARGGITTEKLLRQVDSITQQRAVEAGTLAYRRAISDAPAKVRQAQVLGS